MNSVEGEGIEGLHDDEEEGEETGSQELDQDLINGVEEEDSDSDF